ncbi:hypothetical protein AB0L53_42555 [Nonomuraea sp. NPDC052129]|uniref:hypothetical protein n=1 Tax=Nonomuraea sp. NPDC052129 TaxID=3154651 RepID=UPI00341B075C
MLILAVVAAFGLDTTPWLMAPGIMLAVLVYALLPDWEPHGRRPLRALFQPRLLRGPIGGLTLAAFSLAAGLGSLLGGVLAPRFGRRTVLVGSLGAASVPLLATLALEPGGVPYFTAAILAGALLYVGSPITVVIAQDLEPGAPASAAGMVLGVSAALAGVLYVALGWLQELAGLTGGMAVGFALASPAALIALAVLRRHPQAGV